jgi:sacsin
VCPCAQGTNQHGDGINWQHLPEKLLCHIANTGLSCWPVLQLDTTVTVNHRDLSSVFVAAPSEDMNVLRALASFGMEITQVPEHVFELFEVCDDLGFIFLSPEKVHSRLLVSRRPTSSSFSTYFHLIQSDIPGVKRRSKSAQTSTVMEYLLSTNNLDNIISLPLIPLMNGHRIALKKAPNSVNVVHTLLGEADCEVFGPHDENAIALGQLSQDAARLLESKGPGYLNVRSLTVETVVQLLEARSKKLTTTSLAGSTVQWFSSL